MGTWKLKGNSAILWVREIWVDFALGGKGFEGLGAWDFCVCGSLGFLCIWELGRMGDLGSVGAWKLG